MNTAFNATFVSQFLLYCTCANYLILFIWFGAFAFLHELMYNLHRRWFALTRENFDALHYAGMAMYKVGILLFNLVPYFVLWMLART